jgi:outer membrane protein assembly factor BamB
MRLSIIVLLLLWPAIACGQAKPEDENKVSNDNPARPLQMPPASTEVKEGIDDFERFRRRGAWERALKALYTIPEAQASRFVDGENGFIIPVARKRHSFLAGLPPEGQAAYRLFYDAEARKLLDDAVGVVEQKNLERIYSAYFTSSIGDDAADRLGDLYFELGRFDRAADCWLAVLRDRSADTNLSLGLIAVKAALALSRAGRHSEFEQVRGELSTRYADEKPTLGGKTAAPAELLRLLLDESPPPERAEPTTTKGEPGLDLSKPVEPVWQMRFAESVEAGMTRQELDQWNANFLSGTVPAGAIGGKSLFLNYLGYILALDLESGKLIWRTAAFHHLELQANQPALQMLDPSRLAIVAEGEYVWSLARDFKDQNYFAPFQLTCYRADSGEVVWKSSDLPDYAQLDLVGPPLLADGKLFIAAKSNWNPQQRQGQPQQLVLALRPHDGKQLWRTEVGTFRQGQQYYWGYRRETSPQPVMVYRSGAVYVDTHIGVLARLDADSGDCDWGYGYKTQSYQSGYRFFYYNQPQEAEALGGAPMRSDEAFLIKGMQSDRIYAVEPNRMQVLWERPITKSSRLLGVDANTIYLGGAELSALDLGTKKLAWATRVPNGSMDGRVLVRADGLWQLTSRGIYELDPKSGDVRRIFRGSDLGSAGGDLLLTDHWLLAVSNRAVTAYPRHAARSEVSARVERTPTGALSP